MNKAEFLKDLEKALQVLNQKERNDILSEYEQHIDFKVESGLSEEEAINNFGKINELSVEILDAYNVNLSYGKPTMPRIHIDTQKLHNGVDGFCKKIGEVFSSINKFIKGKWLVFIEKIKSYIKSTRAKGNKKLEQAKQAEQAKPQTKLEKKDGSKKMEFYALMKKAGDSFKNMMKMLWRATKWLVAFFLRAAAVVAILPVLSLMLLLIIAMGFIVILAFGGYPVIGIILITVGVLMCSTTLVWLFIKYVFKKKAVQENG